jgi:hypothetical protein
MPFLDLDDGQRFGNLGKIWIYIVVSIVSTALTFLASRVWDRFLAGSERKEQMEAMELLDNNGRKLLEPEHQVEPTNDEILHQIMGTLRRRNTHHAVEEDE